MEDYQKELEQAWQAFKNAVDKLQDNSTDTIYIAQGDASVRADHADLMITVKIGG